MPASRRTIFGVGFNTTSGTSIGSGAATGTDYPQVGDWIVVGVSFDNQSSTTPTCTALSMSGGGGAVGAFTIANMGAANVATALGSIRVAIGYAQVTTAYTSSPTVTGTLSVATPVRTIAWTAVRDAINPAFYRSASAGFTGAFSYTNAIVAPDTLGIACVGTEANAAPSVTTGTVVCSVNSATGGSAANVAQSLVEFIDQGASADLAGTVSDGGVIGVMFEDSGSAFSRTAALSGSGTLTTAQTPAVTGATAALSGAGSLAASGAQGGGGPVAPTRVFYAEPAAGWHTSPASLSTPSVSWNAGDDIYVLAGTGSAPNTTLNTPTATGLTFAPVGTNPTGGASSCGTYLWKATAASAGSGAITVAKNAGSDGWGFAAWGVRGSDGTGTVVRLASTAKTVSLARTQDKSIILMILGDWSAGAVTGYAFTPAGANDDEASQDGTYWSVYVADWPDQGTAGTTSYGITGGTTGDLSKIAVEVKGTTGSGSAFSATAALSGAGTLSTTQTPTTAQTAALSGGGALSTTQSVVVGQTASLSGSGTLGTAQTPATAQTAALSGGGTLAASGAQGGFAATATLSGSGTLSTTQTTQKASTAALSGSGTLVTSQQTPAIGQTATLSGAGTLSTVRAVTLAATAALSGSGTLTATTGQTATRTAALSGGGTLAATPTGVGANPATSLSGVGTLTIVANVAVSRVASLSGGGTLSVVSNAARSTIASFGGAGTLTIPTTRPAIGITAALAGAGSLGASGYAPGQIIPLRGWGIPLKNR